MTDREQQLVEDFKNILYAYKHKTIDETEALCRLLGSSELWLTCQPEPSPGGKGE